MAKKKEVKIDRKLCKKCVYRGDSNVGGGSVYCNYAAITGTTCLRRDGNDVIDIRGEGPECLLYERGDKIVREKVTEENQIAYGRKLRGEWK